MHKLVHEVGALVFARRGENPFDPRQAGAFLFLQNSNGVTAADRCEPCENIADDMLYRERAGQQVGPLIHLNSLSVVSAQTTVAEAGGATSLSGGSSKATREVIS